MLPAYCRCRHGVQSCLVILVYAIVIIACVNWLSTVVQSASDAATLVAPAKENNRLADSQQNQQNSNGEKIEPTTTPQQIRRRTLKPENGIDRNTFRSTYQHVAEFGDSDLQNVDEKHDGKVGSDVKHISDVHKRSVVPSEQVKNMAPLNNIKAADEFKMENRNQYKNLAQKPSAKTIHAGGSVITKNKNQLSAENEKRLADEKERRRKEKAPPQRVVHIDLKGAPPKADYLIKLIPILKELGATGLLLEWEDTFPYTGKLSSCVSGQAYTPTEIELILSTAKNNSLDVMPLVQTFGHLEWVLKTETFERLRDSPDFSQVICAAHPDAWILLTDMLSQVIDMHAKYGLPYVHIGADEVFQFGTCQHAKDEIQRQKGREKYMLWHIARTARYVKEKANTAKVMIWHDMIASLPPIQVKDTGLHELVEPVVWMYAENVDQYLHPPVWDNLKPFSYAWGASAYKGADGPMRYHSRAVHYTRNQVSWLRQYANHRNKFKEFRGIVLTGWSRYDHFAVLCELLPVALPSLFMSLTLLNLGEENMNHQFTNLKEKFSCPMSAMNGAQGDCNFPGSRIHHRVQELRNTRDEISRTIWSDFDPGFEYNGWMGRMNQEHTFSSAWYIDKLLPQINNYAQRLSNIYRDLETELSQIYDDATTGEFLNEYVFPDLQRLLRARTAANKIRQTRTFQVRPLKGMEGLRERMNRVLAEN